MKLSTLLIFVVVVFLVSTQEVAAQQTASFYFFTPNTSPVWASIYSMPYSADKQPTQTVEAIYSDHFKKYIATFSDLPANSYYIFAYQPMSTTTSYNPDTDLAIFDDNDGQGYAENFSEVTTHILLSPVVKDLIYSVNKDENDAITLTFSSTNDAINFREYNQDDLYIEVQGQVEQAKLDSSCPIYYCGSIQATFPRIGSGTFPIQIENGNSTIAIIPSALTILHPPFPTDSTGIASPSSTKPKPTLFETMVAQRNNPPVSEASFANILDHILKLINLLKGMFNHVF